MSDDIKLIDLEGSETLYNDLRERIENKKGIPKGGQTGQILTKSSNIDYAAVWRTPKMVTDVIVDGKSAINSGKAYVYTALDHFPSGRNFRVDRNNISFNDAQYATAEGIRTVASYYAAHAEGDGTTASGHAAHAEGGQTIADEQDSHAEGYATHASGYSSHAEGFYTTASKQGSHAEGYYTIASGTNAHAEGADTKALGWASHAQGTHTVANGGDSHVFGAYNIPDALECAEWVPGETYNPGNIVKRTSQDKTVTYYISTSQHSDTEFLSNHWNVIDKLNYIEIVGNGNFYTRSNARTLDWQGNEWVAGKVSAGTVASPASVTAVNDLTTKAYVDTAISNITMPVSDVQINGSSIINNGIADIPIASESNLGAVKVNANRGIGIFADGTLSMAYASSNDIKGASSSFKPITPSREQEATFYGLAYAAGDITQQASNNAVGQYTDSAKTAIQQMLDVPSTSAVTSEIAAAIGNINSFDMSVVQALPMENISNHTIYLVPKTGDTNDVYDEYVYVNNGWEMVGNTQIDLSNYVQKNQYATSTTAGLVRINLNYGLVINPANGDITTRSATTDQIKIGTDQFRPITSRYQHESTFYGLAKAAGSDEKDSALPLGTYSTAAKSAIRSMIGAAASSDIPDTSIYATKADTVLESSLSRGRKANTTIGVSSFAFGDNVEASGDGSLAVGSYTIARGINSFARGESSQALGDNSTAEGRYVIALEGSSHAEGGASTKSIKFTGDINATVYQVSSYIPIGALVRAANGFSIVLQIEQINDVWYATLNETLDAESAITNLRLTVFIGGALGIYSHSEGSNSIAIGSDQHVQGKNNYVDENYAHIVGNGFNSTTRSNAYALTWTGDGHYAGDVYIHSSADSSGGTKVLCETDFATDLEIQNIINGGASA